MISNKVLITIILIFFKSYNAVEFLAHRKCTIDLEIIGFDTNTFRNLVLLRSFVMKRDPPIEICDDSVNNDGCDERLYTDIASLPDDREPLLNHTSQNSNEEITNESINVESNSEICDDSVNKDKSNKNDKKSAPLPGDLPGDRQVFLNHALEKLNEKIKENNDKRKKAAMNKDLTLCDDSVNKDGCNEKFYTDTASLPAMKKDPSIEICDDSVNKNECDEKFYTDTASLPAYINEYCDVLIKIKCDVNFRTPLQFCEYLNEQLLRPRAKRCNTAMQSNGKTEINIFNKLANCLKAAFDVQGCKNDIIEKYYDEFNAYKNFIITMNIIDPNMKEYTLEGLNEFALQYFNRQKYIAEIERNKNNDYYINGAGKWCMRRFDLLEKIEINASGTSSASSTSGTS